VTKTIDEARAEVQSTFAAVLSYTDSDAKQSAWSFERTLWSMLLALGRALMALYFARQAARPRPADYRRDGQQWVLQGERTTEIGTRFGKVPFTRPVGRRPEVRRAACDLPVDRELGLCAGFTLGTVLGMVRLVAQMAYGAARETFRSTYEWTPSPRAVMRMVDATGDEARPFLQQAAVPDDDGEVLVIQVDGRGAPMVTEEEMRRRRRAHRHPHRSPGGRHARRARRRENPRKRRTSGKKSKNAKVAVVGVLYTLRRTPEGFDGPINKRLYGTFESHEALFIWLRREAEKRGYGWKQSLFLADGLDAIWRLKEQYFPEAEGCVDWYHIVEKLWSAGECMYKEGSKELAGWVGRQAKRLRQEAIDALLGELRQKLAGIPRTGPGNKGKRTRLEHVIKYLTKHRQRLRYRDLRRRDLEIGSGAVEGAVRNLIALRLDSAGMRWGRRRSELMLHLRCIVLNGQWGEFCEYIASRKGFTLGARPVAAEPYKAAA